jgi:hypothetical protein
MAYSPRPVPQFKDEAGQLALWVAEELRNIARTFQESEQVQHTVLSVEPPRPRQGMVVYADGVNWDPGAGEGQYVFDGTAWVLSSTGPTDVSGFLVKSNNLSDLTNVPLAQDNLNLQPGIDVMAYDPQLTAKIRVVSITTSRTLQLTDAEKCILMQGSTAGQNVTIPAFATTALGQGCAITVANFSSVAWTLVPAAGVTLNWSPSLATGTRTLASGAAVSLLALFDNTWVVTGTGIS